MLAAAVLGFAGGVAGFLTADRIVGRDDSASVALPAPTDDDPEVTTAPAVTSGEFSPRDIYKAVSPAVVYITSTGTEVDTSFFGIPQERESTGTGSGFLIDPRGYIVTNAHVVEGGEEVTVTFGADGVTVPATVVGKDPSSDIAVIKINPKDRKLGSTKLVVAQFGSSSKVQVGDPVVAIGNPFGLDRTLTTGVVSALQREIPSLNDFQISGVIQTDAAVNPGNSGGPLLDAQGRVIGVNSQIQSRGGGFDGVAFAVPSSTVQSVARTLIDDGTVSYAWLGVAGGKLTPDIVDALKLKVDQGVLVGAVTDGSPADKAGIRGGTIARGESVPRGADVLLRFDGTRLESMAQLASLVSSKRAGETVEVELLRSGKRQVVNVKLGERPQKLPQQ